jgi:hypothetical protein
VGSPLPHFDESELAQDGHDLGGFQDRDVAHVSRDRDVLYTNKL